MSILPFVYSHVRTPCESCNSKFRSQSCFDKHKTNKLKGKTVCEQKKNCANCGIWLDPEHKHECFKPFCKQCQQNKEIGHLCYMRPLVNELPRSDNVLSVFYDFESTQDKKIFRFCNRAHSQSSLSTAILLTLRNAAGYQCRLRALWQEKAFLLR